ncbi:MAG: ATP synthase F0 subunit B [Desulfobacterales bacterium]|nr:ATP synthase F0 subunit B [Desulfobacterales bacterium]
MVNLDVSIVFQIVNFLFLIWALNTVLYKPIRSILKQRKEKIEGLEQGVETLTGDATQKEEAFASGIKEARAMGLKEKEALVEAAAEEEKAIIDRISQKAQANLVEIRKQIADEAQSARSALEKEIESFSEAIGQKILGRAI